MYLNLNGSIAGATDIEHKPLVFENEGARWGEISRIDDFVVVM